MVPKMCPIEGLLIWIALVGVAMCERIRLDDPKVGVRIQEATTLRESINRANWLCLDCPG